MATHFIADIHLTGDADPRAARLAGYLAGPARAADALYVLGDLFDVWIGDDGSLARHAATLAAFAKLADAGVPVFFMRGNRDFAVGERFAAAARIQIIDDPRAIDLYARPTLLTHGDLLCTDDTAHQAFRARYTDAAWRARMLALPLKLRRLLARRARRKSSAGKARKAAHIMDVNDDTVAAVMAAHGARRLIHGHTHRRADHTRALAGQVAQRHVLAHWQDDQAEVLVIDEHGPARRALTHAGGFV